MTPYADFTFFGLLLYAVVPTLILGLLGRANWRWALLLTAIMLVIQYQTKLKIAAHTELREVWIVIAFGFWQWVAMRAYVAIGVRGGLLFYGTMAASLLPLMLAKIIPVFIPQHQFAFLGISYVTFRALDIVFVFATTSLLHRVYSIFSASCFSFQLSPPGQSTATVALPEIGKKADSR